MTQAETKKAAAQFAKDWQNRGDEKQETQRFWMGLLGDVLGVTSPQNVILFEKRVQLSHTSYIDAYIPETKVLIEQKGLKIDLDKPQEQSDGNSLTPFGQAKRYAEELPASEKPRWIVVSNFAEIRVHDMERPGTEPEVVRLENLDRDFYRLEFLVDRENDKIRKEEEVSLAAGKLVGKLHDTLIKEYIDPDAESLRSLNVLCVRIVFCLYAEDVGLFRTRTAFEDYVKSFRVENVRDGIVKLFKALDTPPEKRDKYDTKLAAFPYVNGGLFRDEKIEIPNFTGEIVDVLVNDCAPFDWSEISPTIFGAVFESTLNPETRRKGGMHYTSIQNIHKVIDPLFLDDLNEEFGAIVGEARQPQKARDAKLVEFQNKLGKLTFLDPACGSGNFLTETYLSLRRLENKVISALNKGERLLGFDEFIKVKINQFYGIEINDFAVTVAKTALWIAESQMAVETEEILGQQVSFLPLRNHANIVEGNALRMDWATLTNIDGTKAKQPMLFDFEESGRQEESRCGGGRHSEATAEESHHYNYIMGNPPFIGKKEQKDKKEELVALFPKELKGVGNLDYVSGWYVKAIELIKGSDTTCAFVSTNSITQGEQVPVLWKYLSQKGLSINFTYRTFRWDSESTEIAHVHCVIIGFSDAEHSKNQKFIITENGEKKISGHINGYLIDAGDIYVESRNKPICPVAEIVYGSMPIDDNHLILTKEDADKIIAENPANAKFVRKYVGGEEIIKNKVRYCLWLKDATPKEMRESKLISERIKATKEFRQKSTRPQTVMLAETPWLFGEIRQPETQMLAIPKVSSEKRKYIPVAFVQPETIVNGSALIVPEATLYEFGILMSSVHNDWMRAVAGRLETRYQYSGTVVYNNFPWPGCVGVSRHPAGRQGRQDESLCCGGRLSEQSEESLCCGGRHSEQSEESLYGAGRLSEQSEESRCGAGRHSERSKESRCGAGRLSEQSEESLYGKEMFRVAQHDGCSAQHDGCSAQHDGCSAQHDGSSDHYSLITRTAQAILDARAKYPDSSLADLYDDDFMPPDLRKAHEANDRAVMQAYGFNAKMTEAEIVAELFKMYEKLAKK